MLQSVSWQDFLLSSAALALVWYAGLYFLYFRKRDDRSPRGIPPAARKVPALAPDTPDATWIMGAPKLPEGVELMGSQDFGFACSDGKVQQLGLVADVLAELKETFAALDANDGSKADLLGMMQLVVGRYPELADHPNLEQVRDFIADQAPFALSEAELESFWA